VQGGFLSLSAAYLFREERFKRFIDLAFLLNDRVHKFFMVDMLIRRHQCAAPIVLVDLAVAEHIASLHELANQLYAALVIRGEVIAIREVERVNVPVGSRITAVNDLDRLLIS